MNGNESVEPSFWEKAAVADALRTQDIGLLFSLVQQYCGLSQTTIGTIVGMGQGKVNKLIHGAQRVEQLAVFNRIAASLGMPDESRMMLGLAPSSPIPPGHTSGTLRSGTGHSFLAESPEQGEDVERRSFVRLAGIAIAGAAAGETVIGLRSLADVFAGIAAPPAGTIPGTAALAAQARRARADYQACQYGQLLGYLPGLLGTLAAAAATASGDGRQHLHELSADTEQVAAGVLLKLGDRPLASLAADRAMRAAAASGNPVAIGAAARSVTHAMMDSGHRAAAADVAVARAGELDQATRLRTPESAATYGALLLRGAVAAARDEDPDRARELLGEAARAAQAIRPEDAGNVRGTAFSTTNVRLHEVSVAVILGDSGAALSAARAVNPAAVTVTERRASYFIDVGRAQFGRGRYGHAYLALRAADETAPEEVRRPEVRQLASDVAAVAPPSVRRDARQFASAIGA